MIEPTNNGDGLETTQGAGVPLRTERVESGLTALHEARALKLAIKRGWINGQRWATETTAKELAEVGRARDLTLKERAVAETFQGLGHDDGRIVAQYVQAVVAMESQNQKDDLGEPIAAVNLQLGVGVSIEQATNDPKYIEYLRVQRLAEISQSATDGQPSNGRADHNATASTDVGQCDHRDSSGNGRD